MKRIGFIGSFFLTQVAVAHPGHAATEHGLAHWLFDSTHAGILVFILAICTFVVMARTTWRKFQPVRLR